VDRPGPRGTEQSVALALGAGDVVSSNVQVRTERRARQVARTPRSTSTRAGFAHVEAVPLLSPAGSLAPGETHSIANPHVRSRPGQQTIDHGTERGARVSGSSLASTHATRRRADRNPAGPGCWEQMGLGIEQATRGPLAPGQQHRGRAVAKQGGRYQLRGAGVMGWKLRSATRPRR